MAQNVVPRERPRASVLLNGLVVASAEKAALVLPASWKASSKSANLTITPCQDSAAGFSVTIPEDWDLERRRVAVAAKIRADGQYLGQGAEGIVNIPFDTQGHVVCAATYADGERVERMTTGRVSRFCRCRHEAFYEVNVIPHITHWVMFSAIR